MLWQKMAGSPTSRTRSSDGKTSNTMDDADFFSGSRRPQLATTTAGASQSMRPRPTRAGVGALLLVQLSLVLCITISPGSSTATSTMEQNAKVNSGRRQQYRHTPLAHIEATMLTTAGADFAAHQEAYTVATDWHDTRLSQYHRYTSGQPLWSTRTAAETAAETTPTSSSQPTTEHQGDMRETSSPVEQHGGEEIDGPEPLAPYLACAQYKKGGEALLRLRNHLQRTDRAVRTIFHTEEHGACFLATATPDAASVISNDLESFGLWSFGAFPSVLKLAPGLLEHEDAHGQRGLSESGLSEASIGGKMSKREHALQSQQQQLNDQRRKIEDLQRLTTIHGFTMRHHNVNGLNLELTPGILPASSTSKKSRDSPKSTTHAAGYPIDRSVAADALTQRLQDGLLSESIDLFGINFWSDRSLFDEHVERPGARALRARQWTRAAQVVHSGRSVEGGEKEGNGRIVPACELCGWDGVRFFHAGDDLLLVLGMDHLLPSTQHSGEEANELQMACFMGLLSYLADRPEVLRVSSLHMPSTFNAAARAVIQSGTTEETPLSDAGLDGTGEVVQVVDSGIDETSCFFIDDDGEEIEHGYYFEEMALISGADSSAALIIFKGGSYPVDTTRRKIVQYVDLIRPDVAGSVQPYGSGPLSSIYWYTASGFGEDELDGHGTHTAGTVAGSTITTPATVPTCTGTDQLGCVGSCLNESAVLLLQNASTSWDIDGYCPRFDCLGGDASTGECLSDDTAEVLTQHGGVARGAKLAIFDASAETNFYAEMVGNDLWELADETGAKIHSNSWGSDAGCLHQPSGALYDDYMYQNPEHLLIFAAGNSGNYSTDPLYETCSVSSPAIAKNILAVGATSSGASRKPTTTADGGYELPVASDPADIDTVAWFSSRGPTIDNRIKPEVVAPGDQLFSAASDAEDSSSCRLTAISGTSMACPLVAGASAMIRQYFVDEAFYAADVEARGLCGDDSVFACEGFSPSAATVKALIINSANVLGGSSEPDGDRGFGRIHLEAGMPLNSEGNLTLFVADSASNSIAEFTEDVYTFEVSNDTSSAAALQIRATLSWLDPPSSIYAARQLQHDLDLNVTSPAGVSYVMWQTSRLKDSANNNERVVVPAADAAEAGAWTVIVSANALTTEWQDYSLVVTAGNVVAVSAEKAIGDASGAAGRLRVVAPYFLGAGLWSAVIAIVCSAFVATW